MKSLILELDHELTQRIRQEYGRSASKINEIRAQTKEAAVKEADGKKATTNSQSNGCIIN